MKDQEIKKTRQKKPDQALGFRLLSFMITIMLILPNAYYAARLGRNVDYIVGSATRPFCAALAPISALDGILSIAFLGVGAWALVQTVVFRRCSAALFFGLMSIGNQLLLGALFVLGNTYCIGRGLRSYDLEFYSPMLIGAVVIVLPILLVVVASPEPDRNKTSKADPRP